MKTALVTTTINPASVLELYRQHGPDVEFFVALDKNSVEQTVLALDKRTHFITPDQQAHWKCSDLIGFKNIQRRNIALLEALRWGADIIVSVDDDNIPLDRVPNEQFDNYFNHFRKALGVDYDAGTFNGIKVSGANGWFDVGTLLDPVAPHRGFPHDIDSAFSVSHVVDARVEVAAGICLGDPDIGAVTRIALSPVVHRVSELLNSGIVVDPSTWTVFNSQNTAFIRELAPAFFMLPFTGRYDDIYASLIMQRVMREKNLHVHFGKPFVWQQRNQHNLVKDLRHEIDGMENIERFTDFLEDVGFVTDDTVAQRVRGIYQAAARQEMLPPRTIEAALAFLEDMEGVL